MNIARAGLYSVFGTAARLVAGLVLAKLVASAAGPDGIGRLGQFMSLMSLLTVLAGGGISAAIVKYVAEYRADPARPSRSLPPPPGYPLCAAILTGRPPPLFTRPRAPSPPAWASSIPAQCSSARNRPRATPRC